MWIHFLDSGDACLKTYYHFGETSADVIALTGPFLPRKHKSLRGYVEINQTGPLNGYQGKQSVIQFFF